MSGNDNLIRPGAFKMGVVLSGFMARSPNQVWRPHRKFRHDGALLVCINYLPSEFERLYPSSRPVVSKTRCVLSGTPVRPARGANLGALSRSEKCVSHGGHPTQLASWGSSPAHTTFGGPPIRWGGVPTPCQESPETRIIARASPYGGLSFSTGDSPVFAVSDAKPG